MYHIYSTLYLEEDVSNYNCYLDEKEWLRITSDLNSSRLFARIINNNKSFGYIFDGLITNNYKFMIDKIIDYYQTIQNLSNINELTNKENNTRINDLTNAISYNNNKLLLQIANATITIDTMQLNFNENNIKKIKNELHMRKKIENCRDPSICMNHNEELRHTICKTDVWYFNYDKINNCFIYNKIQYKSMYKITSLHYLSSLPERNPSNNAWLECEIYRDNKWITSHNLPIIS